MKKAGIFLSGVLAALVLMWVIAPAWAALTGKTVDVYTGVDIYVNGVQMVPTNEQGAPVDTFIYNGTTYVPIRAVSQWLGQNVQWDGENQRVYIGDLTAEGADFLSRCQPYQTKYCKYYSGDDPDSGFNLAGVRYTQGIVITASSGYALFNLNGQYSSMTLTLGPVDGQTSPADIAFYLDGGLVAEYVVNSGDYPKEISVPLNGAMQLKVSGIANGGGGRTALVNIKVK